MANWQKLPAVKEEGPVGCALAPPRPIKADLRMTIAVGFGRATVTRDGISVYEEPREFEDAKNLAWFEKLARLDPDHDWRAILDAPLSYHEYQRHGRNNWVLIKTGAGFA